MPKRTKLSRGPDASKTRKKIITAAKKLFVQHGFNGTSMRQIAEKAKVTQSLLHHHFGTKATLWQIVKAELMNHYFIEIEKRITSNLPTDEAFALDKILQHRFQFMQKNPDLVKMSLWQFLDKYQHYSTTKGQYLITKLLENLAEAQKSKHIRDDIDPAFITSVIFVMTSGWFQQNYHWIIAQSKSPPNNPQEADSQYLEAIEKILLRGLSVSD